ncbi:hypothetical protein BCR39DRAFT_388795 [Naematelia encephala]|uniref:Uncharacterized protein n=1 Tax=Naematelia encephala TaxID=71784 RepID=A0A1Y2AJ67_9TREE|nr:hypothetical protein BCR39DRAFT_388795 [Naematelia encephala]
MPSSSLDWVHVMSSTSGCTKYLPVLTRISRSSTTVLSRYLGRNIDAHGMSRPYSVGVFMQNETRLMKTRALPYGYLLVSLLMCTSVLLQLLRHYCHPGRQTLTRPNHRLQGYAASFSALSSSW